MIGAHSSISPSILQGIKYIHSLGGTVVQIFAGSNRSSSISSKQKTTEEQELEIKEYLRSTGIYLSIHAIYLLNFCAYPPSSQRIKYAHTNLIYDLELAERIGAGTVVLHIGYQRNLSEEEAYDNMAENVLYILRQTNTTAPSVSLSLETPAGQGTQIASTIPEFAELMDIIQSKLLALMANKEITKSEYILTNNRLKICVDTAHIFSSGYDISTPKGFKDYFSKISERFGANRISLIHLNDSKKPLNSRKDQHEGITDGTIFSKPESKLSLKYLMKWSKKYHIPVVLETHKAGSPTNPDGDLYAQEIGFLSSITAMSDKEIMNWKLNKVNITMDNKLTKKVRASINKTKKQKIIQLVGKDLNAGLLNKIVQIRNFYTNIEPDGIRRKAYATAYLILRNYPEEILSGKQVEHLRGIGKQMVKKIDEYLTTGEMAIFTEKINPVLAEREKTTKSQLNILGFGEKRIAKLAASGFTTVKDIRQGVKSNLITLTDGEQLGLTYYEDLNKLMDRKTSAALFKYIADKIDKSKILKREKASIEIAGSYPAGKKASKDLDILIFTNKYSLDKQGKPTTIPEKIISDIAALFSPEELKIYQIGNTKLMAIFIFKGIARHVDIRLLPSQSEIAGRLYFTSGRDFNVMIRQFAASKGFLLNEYGLFDRKTNKLITLKNEEDLFAKIGLAFIPLYDRRTITNPF
jgi:deoxyribonuclease-4